jgi:Protein of unknown function (DUF3443)
MTTRLSRFGIIAAALALASCGGGSGYGGGGGNPPPPVVNNTLAVAVDAPPAGVNPVGNVLYTSVTVCAPGSSSQCVTVDHVQVDTQSVGLRLMASAINSINSSFLGSLTQNTDSGGHPIFSCITFGDGWSWGALTNVDIQFTADETASAVPVQIVEDPSTSNVAPAPVSCQTGGPVNNPENTPADFGANGLLGLGMGLQDCGTACAGSALPANYYSCTSADNTGVCAPIAVATAGQIQNPVAVLSGTDNNGVVIAMAAASGPAASLAGTLYFGVGTEGNNALPSSAQVLPVETTFNQFIHTTFQQVDYPESVIDAGSNGYFFSSNLPLCTGAIQGDTVLYCVGSTPIGLSGVMQGEDAAGNAVGSMITYDFDIADADAQIALLLGTPSQPVLPNLGGTLGAQTMTFDWGLPTFYGHTVYVVFAEHSATGSSQAGPYMAF